METQLQIPLVDLKAQYATIKAEIDMAISRVLGHAGFILGREVKDFETAFAAYTECVGAVGVASGTAALNLALRACGLQPGDEVLTPSNTFMATAEAISQLGAVPVFVDCEPGSGNLDPTRAEAAITARTRAIVAVHLYGRPADLDPLVRLAEAHGLSLLEDAAQAHGAVYKGRRIGSIGRAGCFSFFPGKNLGAYGDAGAVTSNDPDLLQRVARLRDHGRTSKYEHDEIGYGERMDALQAAILGVKLRHLEQWTEARRTHAAHYTRELAGCSATLPSEDPLLRHVYHLYVIQVDKRAACLEALQARGIQAGVHYPIPVHRQPAYLKQGYRVSLPVTETLCERVLSLPLYPEMTSDQIQYIVENVREVVS